MIDFNGESCLDVDECATGEFDCGAGLSCANTPGSYKVQILLYMLYTVYLVIQNMEAWCELKHILEHQEKAI